MGIVARESLLRNLIELVVAVSVSARFTKFGADWGTSESATLAEHLPSRFPATIIPLGCFHSLLESRQTRHRSESCKTLHNSGLNEGLLVLIDP